MRELHHDVRHLVDPQDRGRQDVAAQLEKLAGTRIASLVLLPRPPPENGESPPTPWKEPTGIGVIGGIGPVPTAPAPCDVPGWAIARLPRPMPPMGPMPAAGRADFERNGGWTDEDRQAAFEERAAIIEFDGGLSRARQKRTPPQKLAACCQMRMKTMAEWALVEKRLRQAVALRELMAAARYSEDVTHRVVTAPQLDSIAVSWRPCSVVAQVA